MSGWRVFNDDKIYQDSYFQEIDERRIERMPKMKIGKTYTKDEFQNKYGKSE